MRLWHYKLLPALPKSQLIAQWRELNSIFANQPKHILINYVYNYPKQTLFSYTFKVMQEMTKRNISINSLDNMVNYFGVILHNPDNIDYFFKEHNNEYLLICFYNLHEKYIRGQKDFSSEQYDEMRKIITKEVPVL